VEVPLNGAAPAPLLATERSELAPVWAPDGIHFAYATDRAKWHEIWLRNRNDGTERLIVSGRDFPGGVPSDTFFDCAISPDGSRVAYRLQHASLPEIWVSSLAGDAPVRLYNDPRKVGQRGPSWSPDGNWIAYYSTFGGKPAVMKIRVGANRPPELVSYATSLNPVRWSPKGDWIAWNDGGRLTLVSPDGRQRRVVSDNLYFTYGWSKDGDLLFGIAFTANRHLAVWRIEIAAPRESVVTDLGPAPAALDLANAQSDFPYRGFSLHPDGKSFLTSVLNIKGDIWLLENFDRHLGLFDRLLRKNQ